MANLNETTTQPLNLNRKLNQVHLEKNVNTDI